jgi:hypothetical protein
MTVRTTSKTVTFMHPERTRCSLRGPIRWRPMKTALVASGLQADCNLATAGAKHGYGSDSDRRNKPDGARGALARDAQPDETVPQRARSEAVVSRKRARGRMKSFSEGWKY